MMFVALGRFSVIIFVALSLSAMTFVANYDICRSIVGMHWIFGIRPDTRYPVPVSGQILDIRYPARYRI